MERFRVQLHQRGPLPYLVAATEGRPPGLRPVLLFLHGYDEGPPTEIRIGLSRHGPLRPGNPREVLDAFIVVAPQLPSRGDLWFHYADVVGGILRAVQERDGGDPERSYLTGFSFGGNGVFDLALLQPQTWAALWAVDPTRPPAEDPQRPVWVSVGGASRSYRHVFVRTLGLHPAEESAADRVYLDEGADHVGSATSAYRDPRIYSWLLTRTLHRARQTAA